MQGDELSSDGENIRQASKQLPEILAYSGQLVLTREEENRARAEDVSRLECPVPRSTPSRTTSRDIKTKVKRVVWETTRVVVRHIATLSIVVTGAYIILSPIKGH